MMKKTIITIFLFICCFGFTNGQGSVIITDSIEWVKPENVNYELKKNSMEIINYGDSTLLQHHIIKYNPPFNISTLKITNFDADYEIFYPENDISAFVSDEIAFKTFIRTENKQSVGIVDFLPIRLNNSTGHYERVVKFKIELSFNTEKSGLSQTYVNNSELAAGVWYKFKVQSSGLYKLTASDLRNIGIDVSKIDPRKIRIHGNGGKMLPEDNSAFRYDDIKENAIFISGENDGKFDDNDYILFFAKGVRDIDYSSNGTLYHWLNPYTDQTYYFLTIGERNGQRVAVSDKILQPSSTDINQVQDMFFYENELYNIGKFGRDWLGESFDVNPEYKFDIVLKDIDLSKPVKLSSYVAGNSQVVTSFTISAANAVLLTQSVDAISLSSKLQYKKSVKDVNFTAPGESFQMKYKYNKNNVNGKSWLGYFELSFTKNLKLNDGFLSFRHFDKSGKITSFSVGNTDINTVIWDVTDYTNPIQIPATLNGSILNFKSTSNNVSEFIAFNGSKTLTPEFVATVQNQNLHALDKVDYFIITHPDFKFEADKLADYHTNKNGLTSVVTTTEQVYNEFSSGAQDISAIRNFLKMIYDKTDGAYPKYVLLFGDCSYDYKNKIQNNTNFVPIYQDPVNTVHPDQTIATDDYFVMLDDGEGENIRNSFVDAAIGRFPVSTLEQARSIVDKTINYMDNSSKVMGNWRNLICLVADDGEDGDSVRFIQDAESITSQINTSDPNINVKKIYFDTYTQVATPGSHRYPEATDAINRTANEGVLVMNYFGHASELGWAKEQVLMSKDVQSWNNYNNIPLVITASCEFTRLDNPERVSAGEWAFLNTNGGAFLISACRPTYGSQNIYLMGNLYKYMFDKNADGTVGDFYKKAKEESAAKDNNTAENTMKYVLVCDPALRLALPKYNMTITEINGKPVNTIINDTIKAFSEMKFKGIVTDENGNKIDGFNGKLTSVVYDKESIIKNKGNDEKVAIIEFPVQKNIIYKGTSVIEDGNFQFEFLTPKDIDYAFGKSKISLYGQSSGDNGKNCIDAAGSYSDIIAGGINPDANIDDMPPMLSLYLNDSTFYNGIITNENPMLIINIKDDSGINVVGNGIGHDMTLDLRGSGYKKSAIINDYYVSDLGTYKSGKINYQLPKLENGDYELTFKAWDIYNNSASETIYFTVFNSGNIELRNLKNYPNPFSDKTTFSFEYNMPEKQLRAEVIIYDMSGRKLKKLSGEINNSGFISNDLIWDRSTDNNVTAGNGIYIYNLKIYDGNNLIADKSAKMVLKN